MKRFVAVIALLLAGCISATMVPPMQYYVLRDTGPAPEARRAAAVSRAAERFDDPRSLVFGPNPQQLGPGEGRR